MESNLQKSCGFGLFVYLVTWNKEEYLLEDHNFFFVDHSFVQLQIVSHKPSLFYEKNQSNEPSGLALVLISRGNIIAIKTKKNKSLRYLSEEG